MSSLSEFFSNLLPKIDENGDDVSHTLSHMLQNSQVVPMKDQEEIQEQDASSPLNKSPIAELLKELESRHLPEEKIQCALLFMESSLLKQGGPDFKAFWEARKSTLSFFREPINPPLRNDLWSKFSELSKEARRLKEIADEQSQYAVEQIEMAVQSIETELADSAALIQSAEDLLVPEKARVLMARWADYNSFQKELNFLNAYASRINSMRKELIKTEMRIRSKNQLFERLSKAGDLLFPRRKELIQKVSEAFHEDVEQFAHRHFGSSGSNVPTFALREEIKEMQNMAKLLTLNAKAFSNTRMKLSACWDALKEKDTQRRKEFEEKKEIFEENTKVIAALIDALEAEFDQEPANVSAHEKKLVELIQQMRNTELGRDDVKSLRAKIDLFKEKLHAKEKEAEALRKAAEEERQQIKRDLIASFRAKAEELLASTDSLPLEVMNQQEEEILQSLSTSALNKAERVEIEKLLKPIKLIAKRKREEALMTLPPDARAALNQLSQLLEDKLNERVEIKEKLEELRKKSKASGLDFNRAIEFNEQVAEENDRLKQVLQSIDEIKEKIEELEQRIE